MIIETYYNVLTVYYCYQQPFDDNSGVGKVNCRGISMFRWFIFLLSKITVFSFNVFSV